MPVAPFRAVLFDWRGTLFHDEDEAEFIRASAASIGRTLTSAEVNALVERLPGAAKHPEVIAAHGSADCSPDLHRAAVLLELGLAGFDDDLALACHDRDGHPNASMPYPDAADVLQTLKAGGVRVGVISDIHYDLAPLFEYYGLGQFIDSYTLSFEHGIQKPDPRLFELALEQLGVTANETLMVGDRPDRDGGAVAVGIATLILPPVPNYTRRGLDLVLRLVQCACC
jgi:HAD superfamily hydrolase (TIGR01509 family)